MQGTQYAPRESILCMEHFVALQRMFKIPQWMRCCCYFPLPYDVVSWSIIHLLHVLLK